VLVPRSRQRYCWIPFESVLDPLDRRRLGDLLAAATEPAYLIGQVLNASLSLNQGLAERLAAAAITDEVDEVGEAALLGEQLRLLQLQRVGQVGAVFGDRLLDPTQDVGDVLRVSQLILDCLEDDLLGRVRPTSVLLS
jgi:hypothetical protein